MKQSVSRLIQRIALLTGGVTLVGLGLKRRRPAWSGIAIAGLGSLMVLDGLAPLRSFRGREDRSMPELETGMDVVMESSEESFPASDPPAWALGIR